MRTRQVGQLGGALVKSPLEVRNLRRLAKSVGASPLELRLPWLPFPVIDLLDNQLTADSSVFEFGGGGSTLFFADRVARVVTVEHDPNWYPMLSDATKALANVELISQPSTDNFAKYISEIDRFPDQSFDLIVVDGRQRVACFEHAIPKLAGGGRLVLDDVNRDYYRRAFDMVSWPRVEYDALSPFKPMLGHTAVFTRPVANGTDG